MQPVYHSILVTSSLIHSNIEITMELFFTMKKKHQDRKRGYYSVTVKCSQTYMFHFGLQCKTFRTWSGCQVSHYVFEGLWFPRSTFTTSEKKKSTKPWWRYYCYRYCQFWCQSLKTHEYKLSRSACVVWAPAVLPSSFCEQQLILPRFPPFWHKLLQWHHDISNTAVFNLLLTSVQR